MQDNASAQCGRRLRIVENFRAIFYTPFYVLKSLGYAEEDGLSIEWVSANVPGGAIDSLKQGRADLTWGGPMRIMKDHDTEAQSEHSLVGFCEVVGRDPFSLVACKQHLPAGLPALAALRLAVVTEVPTPWLCLQADLEDQGISAAQLPSVSKQHSQAEQLAALQAGKLDVMQAFEPYVSLALADSSLGLAYDAAQRGPTTYTVFIATRAGLRKHAAAFTALTRAMARAQKWMAANPAGIADICAEYFPEIAYTVLRSSIDRYVDAGIWSLSPHVQREGFDRLAHSLLRGGFISAPANFECCIQHPGECN